MSCKLYASPSPTSGNAESWVKARKSLSDYRDDVLLSRDYVKGQNDFEALDRVGKFVVRFRGFPLVSRLLQKFRAARTARFPPDLPYFFPLTREDAQTRANHIFYPVAFGGLVSYVSISPQTPIMIGAQNFYASPPPPVPVIGITPMGITIQGYIFYGLFSMAAV